MNKARVLLIVLSILVVLLGVVFFTSAKDTQAESNQGGERHCVARIEPIAAGEAASQVSEPTCFDNFSDAISAATGGAVRLPPDFKPADLTQEILEQGYSKSSPQAQYVIGIDYINSNYSGNSYVWYTEYSDACNSHNYAISPMPSGWDNVVSSARAYDSCSNFYHYENTNYGGSVLNCGGNCATMGIMNDQTSSVRLCKTCAP